MPSAATLPVSPATPEVVMLRHEVAELKRQLDWYRRQLFGRKSERFAPEPDAQQMHLGEVLGEVVPVPAEPEAGTEVPAHKRRKPRSDFADESAAA